MVRQIDVQTLADRLKAGESIHLLDVRQQWEHELVALPGSQHVPLAELSTRAREVQPAEGALVVVYCHHGIRSLSGAALLERAGLTNVVSLAGGVDAWSRQIEPTLPRY